MDIKDTLKIHIAVALKTAPKATRAGLSGKRHTEIDPAATALAARVADSLTSAFEMNERDAHPGPGYQSGLVKPPNGA